MTVIQAQFIGDKAIVPRAALEQLVAIARRSEEVGLEFESDELSAAEMMRLAEVGGSFDFWNEPGEDIYSGADGEAVQ